MKYLKYTYVNKVTGISLFRVPSTEETEEPKVVGLEYSWVCESKFPTLVPEVFGTCPDDSNTNVDGVLEVMTKEAWDSAKQLELYSRSSCPPVLTAKQFRLALLDAELLDDVEDIVKTLPRELQVTWEYGTEIYRVSILVIELGKTLGLFELDSEEVSKIDRIFRKGEFL